MGYTTSLIKFELLSLRKLMAQPNKVSARTVIVQRISSLNQDTPKDILTIGTQCLQTIQTFPYLSIHPSSEQLFLPSLPFSNSHSLR